MNNTPDRTESVFAAAVALATDAERNAYLEQACAGDPNLRGRVEALLRAHERAGHLLDRPAPRSLESTGAFVAHEQPGVVIAGRYKLLEEIGEGGMGTVWVAEQTQPVKRKVAIKLIKAGMDSKSVVARFEAERQALAVMDHPNIAKVLDGGLTETGRPFFVMEYVKGVPITEYCDATRLSVPERLHLFVQVCQAVQHAHQKGIIHRDLKPSNILVAPYDDKAVPKVIDFGLAKAMHHSLTEKTLHTAHETVLGTPLYMSPEQAQLNNLDVDTRSDIYSLGVLLYELLTGTTPLEKKRFKEAAWEEVRRIIREEEPPRPSARLSSTATLPSLAAGRHTEPARLTKLVRGELDWIVMKSLEKDRNRRYETANGFAADVLRHLSGEPVLAAPPSATYRLRKFMRKHRAAVNTTILVFWVIVCSAAFSVWQMANTLEANRFLAQASLALVEQRDEKEKARAAEEAERKQAQKRLRQIEKANDLLGSIFENLDPKEIAKAERPLQAILVEKLDKAVAQLEGESIGDPLVVAVMQTKFGGSLLGLGEYDKGIVLLERARVTYHAKLGPVDPHTLGSMINLALAYQTAGKVDLALPLGEETLRLVKANLGPDHLHTLTSMDILASAYQDAGKRDLAIPLFEETLKLRKAKLGPADTYTLHSMSKLAMVYQDAGKLDLALPLYMETLKLRKIKHGPRHPATLNCMSNLAEGYRAAGKPDLAVPLFEEVLELKKAMLGLEHPETLKSMNNLGTAYQDTGKRDLALPLFVETLKLLKAKLGPDHPDTQRIMNNLALAYREAGKLDLALPLLQETLKLRKAKLGPDHPNTLESMNNLAMAYQDTRKLDMALPLFEETLKLRKAKLGPEHPDTLLSMKNLVVAYDGVMQFDKAELLIRELLPLGKQKWGGDSPDYAGALAALALQLLRQKKWTDAEPLLRESLAIREKMQPDAWTTFNTKSLLGGALLGQKKYTDAEPLLLAGYEGMKQREKTIPPQGRPRLPEAIDRLIELYTATNKPDETKKWQTEKDKLTKAPSK